MEILKPLSDFFDSIKNDYRISITHIGLYAALLHYRASEGFVNPIEIYRCEIMQKAKITGPVTYHKCMRELNEYGYILYQPSRNKKKKSKVYFIIPKEDSVLI